MFSLRNSSPNVQNLKLSVRKHKHILKNCPGIITRRLELQTLESVIAICNTNLFTSVQSYLEDKENNYETRAAERKMKKIRGFSPPANYTDRVTAACRRS
jgi:hypothetical protein